MIENTPKGVRFTTTDPVQQAEQGLPFLLDGPLARHVDHVVRVEETPAALEHVVDRLVAAGAVLLDGPSKFPADDCPELSVDPTARKVMATVALARGILVVAAPLSADDQLARHFAQRGPWVPHHVAFSVGHPRTALRHFTARGYVAGPVVDDGDLAQVFLVSPVGDLIELISRRLPGTTQFSCSNVAALSAAEDQIRVEARA